MTNSEAIETLKANYPDPCFGLLRDAVDKAIYALSVQPDVPDKAEPEKTEYIPDTKAIPSKRGCVDLAERVTAIYYDMQYEEWTQKTVTIADVLDDMCDDYTVLPSAQPERMRGKWEKGVGENGVTTSLFCSECNYENTRWYDWNYCPNCGTEMERKQNEQSY